MKMESSDSIHISTLDKLGPQDRKDFQKFTKYFVYKCVNVIVQSRLGVKLHTQSKHLSSGLDWFNLAIRDNADILSEIKNAYDGIECLSNGKCVCVEISVKTVDGDSMLLESWWLEMNDHCDPSTRISFTVYNRMGVVLKSLLSASRVTPAYRLSRRQGPENYVICYRVFVGVPELCFLGDNYVKQVIGLVPTPIGTLSLSVAYRTVLLISPRQRDRDPLPLLGNFKDNHFNLDQRIGHGGSRDSAENVTIGRQRCGARTVEDLGDGNLVRANSDCSTHPRAGAFAVQDGGEWSCAIENDGDKCLPFERLLEHASIPNQASGNIDQDSSRSQPMQIAGGSLSDLSSGSKSSPREPDSLELLELKMPFASAEEDLSKFYRDCKVAPPLNSFQQSSDVHNMLNSITDQLAQFEANAKDFDEFVKSIQELDLDSNEINN